MVARRSSMSTWLLALLMSVVLTACSGGDGGTATESTSAHGATSTTAPGTQTTDRPSNLPDPCAYLSAADLETVTGLTFDEGALNETMSNESQVMCDWTTNGSEFATSQVLIIPGGADGFEAARAGAESVFGLVDVDVPGADQVYATEEGSIVGMVIGADFAQVAYIPPGPGNVLDETSQLAAIVAANFTG